MWIHIMDRIVEDCKEGDSSVEMTEIIPMHGNISNV